MRMIWGHICLAISRRHEIKALRHSWKSGVWRGRAEKLFSKIKRLS